MKKSIFLLIWLCAGLLLPALLVRAETLPTNITKSNTPFLLELKDVKQIWYIDLKTKTRILLGQPSTTAGSNNLTALSKEKKFDPKTIKKYSFNLGKLTGTDTDKDGLVNSLEDLLGTNKNKADSDGDKHGDKEELVNGYNAIGSGKISIYKAKSLSGSNDIKSKLAEQKKIKSFKDAAELKAFMNAGRYSQSGYGISPLAYRSLAMDSSNSSTGLGTKSLDFGTSFSSNIGLSEASPAPADYSQTNIQVEGVDEGDIVKTDGKYIYAIAQNKLNIIKSWPAGDTAIVSNIEFDSQPNGLYLDGDILTVYGNDIGFLKTPVYKKFRRHSSYSFVKIYDIKDRANPKKVRDLKFEGQYGESRMINGYLYYVTSMYNFSIVYDFVLPKIVENGQVISSEKTTSRYIYPKVYYFNLPYDRYNFNTVSAINIRDNNKPVATQVYLMPNNQTMYVSENNIYLTYTKYISEYDLTIPVLRDMVYGQLDQVDKDYITKLEAVDSDIISDSDKQQRISMVIGNYIESLSDDEQSALMKLWDANIKKRYADISKELEKTVIQKVAIKGSDLSYVGSGEVTGQVLNQFAMDEQNGFLRIATTKNRTWLSIVDPNNSESYNNLYTLGSDLKVVGTLENLAKTEKIYSIRFIEDRAYMVTYRTVDPLFVIDVADPKNPKVLGELKVPGFSSYLHPYDKTTLIGVGKQTEVNQYGNTITKGLKISLFDVSEVANPKVLATYEMGGTGSDSLALNDHKAFLFSRDKKLLVIPVSLTKETTDNTWGGIEFSGAAVLNIDKTGITLKGKVDHSNATQDNQYDWYGYYRDVVLRSLYIDNFLYTLSGNMLKVNSLNDLSETKKIVFPVEDKPVIINGIPSSPPDATSDR
jgi:inhibitor of cysteine peptidase